jgi:hypothetical protein
MTIPTSYDDNDLLQFMHTALAETAGVMGWTVALGSYDDALIDCLLSYQGVTQAADCTDLRKLRSLARVSVWAAVAAATAADFNFSADGASYSRSQVHDHAMIMLAAAQQAAIAYDPGYVIRADTESPQSPYRYQAGDEYAHRPGYPIE